MAAAVFNANLIMPLTLLLLSCAYVRITLPYGANAADAMLACIVVAALFAESVPSPISEKAVLVFICAQVILAYSTAGLMKCSNWKWYNGSFVRELFSTESFGLSVVTRGFRRFPPLAPLAGTSIVVGETLFWTVLLVPLPFLLVALGVAFMFHWLVAAVMGLNTFVWSFLATYPAIIFCATAIHGSA
ncbi:MAG TPA: hypothetical protein VKR56_15125 [Candidatus Cybelea sp.]|nr:hypothetical protein [Candidatus Cybelea sp.]